MIYEALHLQQNTLHRTRMPSKKVRISKPKARQKNSAATALKVAKIAGLVTFGGAAAVGTAAWYSHARKMKVKLRAVQNPASQPEEVINEIEEMHEFLDQNMVVNHQNEVYVDEPNSPREGLPFNMQQLMTHLQPQLQSQIEEVRHGVMMINSRQDLTPSQRLDAYEVIGREFGRACAPVMQQCAIRMQAYKRPQPGIEVALTGISASQQSIRDLLVASVLVGFALLLLVIYVLGPTVIQLRSILPKYLQPLENVADGYGSVSQFVRFIGGFFRGYGVRAS